MGNAKKTAWGQTKDDSGKLPKERYHKLTEGVTCLRFASDPVKYWVHWVDGTVDGKQARLKFICPGKDCPLCKSGETPKVSYVAWILPDPSPNGTTKLVSRELKAFEFGVGIYNDVNRLAADEDYGAPQAYDVKIERTGTGQTTKYSTKPRPVQKCEPWTEELDERLAAEPDLEELYAGDTVEHINRTLSRGLESEPKLTDPAPVEAKRSVAKVVEEDLDLTVAEDLDLPEVDDSDMNIDQLFS